VKQEDSAGSLPAEIWADPPSRFLPENRRESVVGYRPPLRLGGGGVSYLVSRAARDVLPNHPEALARKIGD